MDRPDDERDQILGTKDEDWPRPFGMHTPAGRRSVPPDAKRGRAVPWSTVERVTEQLGELTGTEWFGWDAVEGATTYATYRKDSNGRWVVSGLLLIGDAIRASQLREVPIEAMEDARNTNSGSLYDEIADLPPLDRYPGMQSEEFSRRVAQYYNAFARYTRYPAIEMAKWKKVKPATMHTWIREARLRGFLPPAKRGKGSGR